MWSVRLLEQRLPYFLEISPHLEILPPSKCSRNHKKVGSNKHRPRISPYRKGSSDSKYAECYSILNNAHRQIRKHKAGEWTSRCPRNFATLEMSPQGAATLKLFSPQRDFEEIRYSAWPTIFSIGHDNYCVDCRHAELNAFS